MPKYAESRGLTGRMVSLESPSDDVELTYTTSLPSSIER